MENKEIMVTEEITEVVEEAIPNSNGKLGIGLAIGCGIVLGGIAACKYVVSPLVGKIKANIEAKKAAQAEMVELELVSESTEEAK